MSTRSKKIVGKNSFCNVVTLINLCFVPWMFKNLDIFDFGYSEFLTKGPSQIDLLWLECLRLIGILMEPPIVVHYERESSVAGFIVTGVNEYSHTNSYSFSISLFLYFTEQMIPGILPGSWKLFFFIFLDS